MHRLCLKVVNRGMINEKQILLDVEILESEILDNKRSMDCKVEKVAKVEIQMTSQENDRIRTFCYRRKKKEAKALKSKVKIQMTN